MCTKVQKIHYKTTNFISYIRNFFAAPASERSFTLVELLVVIGILSVLSAATVILINPAEIFKESRDGQRISDISTLATILSKYKYGGIRISSLGNVNTIYVSLADSSQTCANLGLPAPPSEWSYNCVSSANLQKVDGTGWIPVNFTGFPTGPLISALPIDPTNATSSSFFYSYAVNAGGKFEVNTTLESLKKLNDTATSDGGDSASKFEKGEILNLLN